MSDRYSPLLQAETLLTDDDDPGLPAGQHLAVSLDPGAGLPVGPLVVWPVQPGGGPDRDVTVLVTDPEGRSVGLPADVAPDRPLTVTLLGGTAPGRSLDWVEVIGDDGLRVAVEHTRRAPDGAPVELAVRTAAPYRLAAAGASRLRITGAGVVGEVRTWSSWAESLSPAGQGRAIGLPAELLGDLVGYLPALDAAAHDATTRVEVAAPAYLPPFDDPGGAGVGRPAALAGGPGAETARVDALTGPGGVRDWVLDAHVGRRGEAPGPFTVAGFDPGTLLTRSAAVDPGLARWLGWTADLRALGVDTASDDWRARWLVLVALAVPARAALGEGVEPRLLEMYLPHVDQAAWQELTATVRGDRRLVLALASAPGVLGSPPDPPPAPGPVGTGRTSWLPDATPPPGVDPRGDRWSAQLVLGGPAPRGPVSLVRATPAPTTTHRELDGAPGRHAPRAAGWVDLGGVTRCVAVDADVPGHSPVDHGPTTWSLRVGDRFGRWGPAATVTCVEPLRPPPVPPGLRTGHHRADGGVGTVDHRVAVPPAGPAGAHPVVELRLNGDGLDDVVFPVLPGTPAGTEFGTQVPGPATDPGGWVVLHATAVSVDAAGVRSEPTRVQLTVVDPRPVQAPTVSPRLLHTGRRAGGPTCELELTWPAVPGAAGYLVLEAAESVLLGAAGLQPAGGPRARRAAVLLGTGAGRDRYAPCADATVEVTGGVAHARIRRPAGQSSVTLLRILSVAAAPAGGAGVTSPFAACAPFPVVVPLDEVPGAPLVEASEPADGEVVVRVTVPWLDPAVLALLDDGPPQARLQRVPRDGGADPFGWPQVAVVDLRRARPDDEAAGVPGGAWTGTTVVPVADWTTTELVASARYPAETTAVPGALVAEAEVRAVPPAPGRVESPWGPPGVPVVVLADGGALPAAQASVTAVPGEPPTAEVVVTGLTVAPPSAPAPVQLELYAQRPGAGLALVATAPVTEPTWTSTVPGPVEEVIAVQVDPFGRRG